MNGPKRGLIGVVIVLIVVLLSISVSAPAAQQGCYTFTGSETNYCKTIGSDVAQQDCTANQCGDYTQFFAIGQQCDRLEACEVGFCRDTCRDDTRGKCGEGNFLTVVDNEAQGICQPGCCAFTRRNAENQCDFYQNLAECEQLARVLGGEVITWRTDVNQAACLTQVCQAPVGQVTLTGIVTDQDGNLLVSARVVVGIQSAETDGTGRYDFSGLLASEIEVTATYIDPSGQSFTTRQRVTVRDGENSLDITIDLTARPFRLSGTVKGVIRGREADGPQPLRGVIVRVPPNGYDETDGNGRYDITLPGGDYTLIVEKAGYQRHEQSIALNADLPLPEITLALQPFQGVRGKVIVKDSQPEQAVPGAFMYVNDVRRTFSNVNGEYQIDLPRLGEYRIYATHPLYEQSEPQTFTLTLNQPAVTLPIQLTPRSTTCLVDGEIVPAAVNQDAFLAKNVRGEPTVELTWVKPCPEVQEYELVRSANGQVEPLVSIPADRLYYSDGNLNWGTTYQYELRARYARGDQVVLSEAVTRSIDTGDEECANKPGRNFCMYITPTPVEEHPEPVRQTVYYCTEKNQLRIRDNCESIGANSFCVDSESGASCSANLACAALAQDAQPFGLYFTKEQCYGEDNTNACYYDYTETQSNTCQSCQEVTNCFDYLSRDACQTNRCLAVGQCAWVEGAADLVSWANLVNEDIIDALGGLFTFPLYAETGRGYCTEKEPLPKETLSILNQNKPEGERLTDSCSLCGANIPPSALLENYWCTPNVCRSLGECYSQPGLDACQTCNERTTCSQFQSELECTNSGLEKQSISRTPTGLITTSDDVCSLGRCAWINGNCVKDGNGDKKDDCTNDTCRRDNQPPITTINPPEVTIVTLHTPPITFEATDTNDLQSLSYCLSATPEVCSSFTEVLYDGETTVTLNVADILTRTGAILNGQPYYLRYYSTDEYDNQESAQEQPLVVDIQQPTVMLKNEFTTTAGKTTLDVEIASDELATCSLKLTQLSPAPEADEFPPRPFEERNNHFTHPFTDLEGFTYRIEATCSDNFGNKGTDFEIVTFDVVGQIEIVAPRGLYHADKVPIEIHTLIDAHCSLYNGREYVGDLATEDNKVHTGEITQLTHGQYWDYNVICTDFNTPPSPFGPAYLFFTVDFEGPHTKAILKEGERTLSKGGPAPWEEFFVNQATVTLECVAEGFACAQTEWCRLTSSCEFNEYTEPLVVEETSTICYRSTDEAGNREPPICGKVNVDGFGIRLINPPAYEFNGKRYAVSNRPLTDLQLTTQVPVTSCKFDFRENFEYETLVDPGKQFHQQGNTFIRRNFPKEYYSRLDADEQRAVYIRCQDLGGQISVAQAFLIEFDPSAPEILSVTARPELVTSGNSVELVVETDDKTFCKYDKQRVPYQRMQWEFPETGEELHHTHRVHHLLTARDRGPQVYFVACANGAGVPTPPEAVRFTVDFSQRGTITSTQPEGRINYNQVTLQAETNTFGQCSYQLSVDEGPRLMAVTGEGIHSQPLGALADAPYLYPLQCLLGSFTVDSQFTFAVDTTAPQITEMHTPPFSCSLTELSAQVSADESITHYRYEVYEKESNQLLTQGTVEASQSFIVPALLTENSEYYFKVSVTDEVGHTSAPIVSEAIRAVPFTAEICQDDFRAPQGNIGLGVSEESTDIDGDTIENRADNCPDISNLDQLDQDNDGAGDRCDPDVDGDGIANFFDRDTPRGTGTAGDINGDGISNEEDADVDGDGTVNIHDSDVDGDGIPNAQDTDDDNDGQLDQQDHTPTGLGTPNDLDGDGITNANDPDMDGDGTVNVNDSDVDGDDVVNASDRDTPVGRGTPEDIDGDGILNNVDTDMDGDGIPNQQDDDIDGDGILNIQDSDRDGDGIPDVRDAQPRGPGTHSLTVSPEVSCQNTVANIFCTDATGCRKILYGTAFEREKCQPTNTYNGQRLFFNRTTWLCSYLEDVRGNNVTISSEVTFADKDSDHVADSCDKCEQTSANTPVDNTGCALAQVPTNQLLTDADGDGLPDPWEEKYRSTDCPFDKAKEDSNDNRIEDNREDYDSDGYSNYMEFVMETNPCEVSVVDTDGDGIPNNVDQCIDTLEEDRDNVDRDADSPLYGCTEDEERDVDAFSQSVDQGERPSSDREEPGVTIDTAFTGETSTLAWGFIIAGILLLLGGSGYLLYQRFRPLRKKGAPPMPPSKPASTPSTFTPQQKQMLMRRTEQERTVKSKRRGLLFESFASSSKAPPPTERPRGTPPNVFERLQKISQGKKK